MKLVQRIMRHKQFRTTADTYAHLMPDSLDKAAARFSEFIRDSEDHQSKLASDATDTSRMRSLDLVEKSSGGPNSG